MDSLASRDSRHPRDSLMTFSNLPAKRRSPLRVVDSPVRAPLLRTPLKVATPRVTTRSNARQVQAQTTAVRMSTKKQTTAIGGALRKRGRQPATISTGMSRNTFVHKCQRFNQAISQLKQGFFFFFLKIFPVLVLLTTRIRCYWSTFCSVVACLSTRFAHSIAH